MELLTGRRGSRSLSDHYSRCRRVLCRLPRARSSLLESSPPGGSSPVPRTSGPGASLEFGLAPGGHVSALLALSPGVPAGEALEGLGDRSDRKQTEQRSFSSFLAQGLSLDELVRRTACWAGDGARHRDWLWHFSPLLCTGRFRDPNHAIAAHRAVGRNPADLVLEDWLGAHSCPVPLIVAAPGHRSVGQE